MSLSLSLSLSPSLLNEADLHGCCIQYLIGAIQSWSNPVFSCLKSEEASYWVCACVHVCVCVCVQAFGSNSVSHSEQKLKCMCG